MGTGWGVIGVERAGGGGKSAKTGSRVGWSLGSE